MSTQFGIYCLILIYLLSMYFSYEFELRPLPTIKLGKKVFWHYKPRIVSALYRPHFQSKSELVILVSFTYLFTVNVFFGGRGTLPLSTYHVNKICSNCDRYKGFLA